MRDYTKETADHTERMADKAAEAAGSFGKIASYNDLSGFGLHTGMTPGLDMPTLPGGQVGNIPSEIDVLETLVNSGRGTNTATGTPAQRRQMTNQERSLLSRFERQAADLERRGSFSAADRRREAGERAIQRSRETEAARDIQRELGLSGGARMKPEDIALATGSTRLDQEELKRRTAEIESDIKRRAGGEDGTEAAAGVGPAGKSRQESPLERIVGEIKSLVEKIEPKLPVAVLV
jgi:hypothetical protein